MFWHGFILCRYVAALCRYVAAIGRWDVLPRGRRRLARPFCISSRNCLYQLEELS
jgi:hypothetical protein